MNNTRKKRILRDVLLAVGFITFCWVGIMYQHNLDKKKWRLTRQGEKVEGVAFNGIDINGRAYQRYEFFVDGKKIKTAKKIESNYFMEDGEMFYVYYDSNDYKNSVIAFWEYIIPKDVDTSMVIDFDEDEYEEGIESVGFKYKVNDKVYERRHYIRLDKSYNKKDMPRIVLYSRDNPKIAYILME